VATGTPYTLRQSTFRSHSRVRGRSAATGGKMSGSGSIGFDRRTVTVRRGNGTVGWSWRTERAGRGAMYCRSIGNRAGRDSGGMVSRSRLEGLAGTADAGFGRRSSAPEAVVECKAAE